MKSFIQNSLRSRVIIRIQGYSINQTHFNDSRLFASIRQNSNESFRRLLSSGTYKTSTGIVGLDVDPNGRENLIKLADTVLESVKKIPESAAYRESVEQWFTFIKNTAVKIEDIKAIEDEIDLGQIEEVIEMAKTELELIDFYFDNKAWELVAEAQAEAEEIAKDMSESLYFTSNDDTTTVINKTQT